MYKRVIIVPYKMGSKAAKALKDALVAAGVRCFRKQPDAAYIQKRSDLVLYYGGTAVLPFGNIFAKNYVRNIAQNKLYAFRVLRDRGLSTVPWTEDRHLAEQWPVVVCRHTLTGHSGQGITIWDNDTAVNLIPIAPLYTQYIKKTFECRIHVYNGSVIDAQIKKKERGAAANPHIRNHHTGWVYCREGYTPTQECKELAINAVKALELDFGAVDLIYNKYYNQYYILEVNTAPGLTGTTLTKYMETIKNEITAQ